MKKMIFAAFLALATTQLLANELNSTLVRIINQINAILPLLDEAQTEVDPKARLQLHIESFEGADGKTHPGLRTDLLRIRNALIAHINQPVIEPKAIKPLTLDFVDNDA